MSTATGLEPLKPFLPGLENALEDSEVSEIMINGPGNVWIERAGRLEAYEAPNLDGAALLRAAIHIARPLGLDPESSPLVDARLDDGSWVAICVPPASPQPPHQPILFANPAVTEHDAHGAGQHLARFDQFMEWGQVSRSFDAFLFDRRPRPVGAALSRSPSCGALSGSWASLSAPIAALA